MNDIVVTQFAHVGIHSREDSNKRYYYSPHRFCKGWTKLMKYVLLTKKYPELEKQIKEIPVEEINKQNEQGHTALMLACKYSNKYSSEKTVQILLDLGANIRLQDKLGFTALMYACQDSNISSSLNTVQMLVDSIIRKNDPSILDLQDNDDWTALMICSRYVNYYSSEDTVQLLLNASANPNIQKKDGWTALMLASEYGKTERIVQMLLDANANPDLQEKYGQSALTLVLKYKEAKEGIVQALLEGGADPNPHGINSMIPLMKAVKHRCPESIIQMLLWYGADPNTKDNMGNRAIDFASSDSIKNLLLRGHHMVKSAV